MFFFHMDPFQVADLLPIVLLGEFCNVYNPVPAYHTFRSALFFVGRFSGMVASWELCARACEQHNNWYWPEKKHLKVGEINTFVFSLH